MELIFISYRGADIRDGQGSQLQQFRGFYHTVVYQEFLRGFSHGLMENLSKIAAVDSAHGCNVFNGYVILKILLDIADSLFDIKITHFAAAYGSGGSGRLDQVIEKKIQMPNQMKGRFI